jgi:hypothetical protein
MLPNFLILGAQKSGTTSLLDYLDAHPRVFMSPSRETGFFLYPYQYLLGTYYYEATHFAEWSGEPAVGEKTPEYLYHPEIPRRVAEMLGPAMKFVIVLRSPAARAHSGYRHGLMLMREQRSFAQAIADELAQGEYWSIDRRILHAYLDRGRYARQLQAWADAFGGLDERFLVFKFEDFVADQAGHHARLCEFLGVPYVEARHASGEAKPRRRVERRVWRPNTLIWGKKKIRSPSPSLLRFADGYQAATEKLGRLSREQELELNRRHFQDDAERLARLVDLDLGDWFA